MNYKASKTSVSNGSSNGECGTSKEIHKDEPCTKGDQPLEGKVQGELKTAKTSVEACRRNIKFNGSVASEKVESNLVDARVYMLTHPKEFDVVDLDPYGSPSMFLDSAVQSIADGGC
ncbi:putative tRNA (guanine(26)-N(2))-dimethyltransferase [Helianthus annuus]|nr:putative tRNA (guanine(26)-N(2))-dimethyltransferase [Helianthus annuus]